jgi:hypothetical protein
MYLLQVMFVQGLDASFAHAHNMKLLHDVCIRIYNL